MPGIGDWINSPLDIVQRFYGRPANTEKQLHGEIQLCN